MSILNTRALITGAFMLLSSPVFAQIDELRAYGGLDSTGTSYTAENLVMGVIANTGTWLYLGGYFDWSSPQQPSYLYPGYAMTFGPNDGRISYWRAYPSTDHGLRNASARGVIRGADNNGGYTKEFTVGVDANQNLTILIWGPTLNSYGVSGATNFSWRVEVNGTIVASGTGESTVNISLSTDKTVNVFFEPTDYAEVGSVMAHFNIN